MEVKEILWRIAESGSKFRRVNQRSDEIMKALDMLGFKYYESWKPNAGSCVVRETRNEYRLFTTCGYGRYNYGWCYVIEKDDMSEWDVRR